MLPVLAERYGLTFSSTGKTAVLRHALAEVKLDADSRQIRFNGTLIWLNDGIRLDGTRWSVSSADASTAFAPLLDPQAAPPVKPPARIVLDAGHGGEDAGAKSAGGLLEKDLNLPIVLAVAERLRGTGAAVWVTRGKDIEVSLPARSRAAASVFADVFVSVHMNSATNRAVAGVETYLLPAAGFMSTIGRNRDTDRMPGNSHDAASQILAYDVHRAALARTDAQDRGVRRARFDVLSMAPCPAILVECGFISNPKDAESLATAEYRARLAEGIAQGIMTYVSRCEAQARRQEPLQQATPAESVSGNAQTGRTDREVQDPPPDGTGR